MSVCSVFDCVVNCLLNVFAICVGEVTVFSLKVIVLVFCWPIRVLSSKECVCCVCLGVLSICLICVFV